MTPTPSQERWVLVKEFRYADNCERFYFVGEDEGWSAMSHLAQIFTVDNLTPLLKNITSFYDKEELHLKLAPSSVRSILVYPQAISQDWNHA